MYAAPDLKDTYFHIATHPDHQKFLRFVVNGIHYQFTVLPFSLSAACCIITKCRAQITVYLQRLEIHVIPPPGRLTDERPVRVSITVQYDHHSVHLQNTRAVLQYGQISSKTRAKNRVYRHMLGCYKSQSVSVPVNSSNAQRPDLGSKSISSYQAHTWLKLLGHMAACTCIVQHTRLHFCPQKASGMASVGVCPLRRSLGRVISVP